jgi:hypothetical protein
MISDQGNHMVQLGIGLRGKRGGTWISVQLAVQENLVWKWVILAVGRLQVPGIPPLTAGVRVGCVHMGVE